MERRLGLTWLCSCLVFLTAGLTRFPTFLAHMPAEQWSRPLGSVSSDRALRDFFSADCWANSSSPPACRDWFAFPRPPVAMLFQVLRWEVSWSYSSDYLGLRSYSFDYLGLCRWTQEIQERRHQEGAYLLSYTLTLPLMMEPTWS